MKLTLTQTSPQAQIKLVKVFFYTLVLATLATVPVFVALNIAIGDVVWCKDGQDDKSGCRTLQGLPD